MISVILIVADVSVPVPVQPELVGRGIAGLIPALVEGVIRDLVLATIATDRDSGHLAEHAGCELAIAEHLGQTIVSGLAAARGDLILTARADYAPGPGFISEIVALLAREGGAASALALAESDSLLTRLAPSLARPVALLAPRYALASGAADFDALVRVARPRVTLRSRWSPA